MLRAPSFSARPAIAALLIAVAAVLAWGHSLAAPFEMDDQSSILENATLRRFWTFGWLRPPATAGETVSGRPVLNFTFALNHALGGDDVRGYRALNVLIHALAALTLFGILRRTVAGAGGKAQGAGRDPGKSGAPGGGAGHDGFALTVALIWLLHPLQTESVTYVVQRAESLAGLFGLLTLYGFVRGVGGVSGRPPGPAAAAPGGRPWFAVSVICCLLGMATKEVMVFVPIVVWLYDRAFVAGSLAGAWRRRRAYYLALASTWLVLAALVAATGGRGGSAGFGGAIRWWEYALTQCQAVVHYLRLSLWPQPLVFDYGVPVAHSLAEVGWQAAILLVLLGGVVWALAGDPATGAPARRAGGLLGAAFFLLLAPSSSVLPVATQTIAEHRMYLPLIAVVALAGAAVCALARRLDLPGWLAGILAAGAILALGAGTRARNEVYRSPVALWRDTVAGRPDNPRAHHNLGMALAQAGRDDEAMAEFRRAIALEPNHAFAHFELGAIQLRRRQWTGAAAELQLALAADPHDIAARVNLGRALAQLDRPEEAIAQFRAALADEPGAADARADLGALLVARGHGAEGVTLLREAVAAAPDLAEAHLNLGLAVEKADAPAAEAEFREAVRLKPGLAAAHLALGNLLAGRDDASGAEACYREALRLDAGAAGAHFAWGNLLAGQRRLDEAMTAYREALRLDPAYVEARNNLANCQLATGRLDEAIANYEAVLRVRPDDAAVGRNLDLAREVQRSRGGGR